MDYFVSGEWSNQAEGPVDGVGCVASTHQRQQVGPATCVCLWGVRGHHSGMGGIHLWVALSCGDGQMGCALSTPRGPGGSTEWRSV